MNFQKTLISGEFIKRYKRFFVDVKIGNNTVTAHCPNTGSMLGLLNKGNKEIAKKIAEEANELAISAVSNDGRILDEAADLMYHLQVLLIANNLTLNDLQKELSKRNK